MNLFDRFSDWLARVWAGAPWFGLCLAFVGGWLAYGATKGLWSNSTWHLSLNSPTTALTFLGVFALHNTTNRYERAANERWERLYEHLNVPDPTPDPGQKPRSTNAKR